VLSIVVPACNEEKRIKDTISDLRRVNGIKEIIVVCNGCTDRTAEMARSLKVKVMEIEEKDKGRAVLTGLSEAKSDMIGFVDADGAFTSESISRLLSKLSNNDAIIASKWKGQSFRSAHGPFGRKFASRVWNKLTKLILGLRFSDTQAGLKIIRKNAFDSIDTDFVCSGFAFDAELLYKIKKSGGKIEEVYIPVRDVKTINGKISTFSIVRAPSMFMDILRLWLREKLKGR
jgi:glycosyltransferase involved in cell wall biosynthesis